MRIASVGRALPPNEHAQEEVSAHLARIWSDAPALAGRLPALHASTGVRTRRFALPLAEYAEPRTFGETNRLWLENAVALGQHAVEDALARAGVGAGDVDLFIASTITGVACPSIDARIMNRLSFREDCRRLPLFGLGCVAGAAGIARAADHLRAFPEHVVLLLAVELCSLTFAREDHSMAQAIAAGLFGDGAAAVVLVGEARARRLGLGGPRVLATRSVFYRGTEDVMGWDVSERGFRVVLSPRVPELARERLAPDVRRFLADHGATSGEVARWVAHPGGPRVLRELEAALELGPDALAVSWRVLAELGNVSSASVLLILRETLDAAPPPAGALGVLFAMGPAFCSELVLLGW